MENATKALLISAGVMIGIMIISMGVYLYTSVGSYVSQTQDLIEENAINKFNTQFWQYQEEDEVSFQDIITVANIAYESNYEGQIADDAHIGDGYSDYVQVDIIGYVNPNTGLTINGTYKNLEKQVGDSSKLAQWLKYNYDGKYKCTEILVSTETKRVYKITFEKI